MNIRACLLVMLLGLVPACARAPLATVDHVDLQRYAGKWYDVAHLPQWFQRDCHATTAEYAPNPDGILAVVNTCHKGSVTGPVEQVRGTARVVDPQTNAKLKVRFYWPFEGDYWILRLTPDYSAAAVGTPDRKALWFLSRAPTMDKALADQWTKELSAEGFDMSKLEWTHHSP